MKLYLTLTLLLTSCSAERYNPYDQQRKSNDNQSGLKSTDNGNSQPQTPAPATPSAPAAPAALPPAPAPLTPQPLPSWELPKPVVVVEGRSLQASDAPTDLPKVHASGQCSICWRKQYNYYGFEAFDRNKNYCLEENEALNMVLHECDSWNIVTKFYRTCPIGGHTKWVIACIRYKEDRKKCYCKIYR